MINRPSDILPAPLVPVLSALGKREWLEIRFLPNEAGKPNRRYSVHPAPGTPPIIGRVCRSGSDYTSMWCIGKWIANGPKTVRPTLRQCEALAEVEIRIPPALYRQPFPSVLVDLPPEFAPPQRAVLMSYLPLAGAGGHHVLVAQTYSVDHLNDVVNMMRMLETDDLEAAIALYHDNVGDDYIACTRAYRVCLNLMMLLTNYGHTARPLLPKDVASDEGLVRKFPGTDKARKAQSRMDTALTLLEFSQDVKVYDTAPASAGVGNETHASPRPHWRRGHWANLACGVGRTERRLHYRPPVLVMAEHFVGDLAHTSATYHPHT
jgi:hypothetical protein